MAKKELTQVGLNRTVWVMLKKLGGKVIIPEQLLDNPNQEDAILVQYFPKERVFVLSIHKVKDNEKNISNIISPSRN